MVSLNEQLVHGVDRFGFANCHIFFFGTLRQHRVDDVHVLFEGKYERKSDVVFFLWNWVTKWNIVRFVTKALYPLGILASHLANPCEKGRSDEQPRLHVLTSNGFFNFIRWGSNPRGVTTTRSPFT